MTPECTRAIHHYSIASRAEYVDDLIRQLRLSGVSYVIINFDSLERQKARPHGNEEQAH